MTNHKSTPTWIAKNGFLILLACAVAYTVVTGLVYGRFTQRWGPVPDLLAKGRHLETFPKEIGDWLLLKEDTLSELIQETLSCTGYVNRQYVNRKTGERIGFAVYVGPAGPISVHTPEICYSSQAYAIQEPRKVAILPGPADQTNSFWQLTFRSTNKSADLERVYYAWSTGGSWMASESPRFEFGGLPALYKLQIAAQVPPADESSTHDDPCKEFLTELLRSGWNLE